MTQLLIVILLLLTLVLIFTHFKKTSIALLLITLIIYITVGSGLWAALLLTPLQKSFLTPRDIQWKKNNALIILGGGAIKLPGINIINPTLLSYSRIYQTAVLYKACLKSGNRCTIITSGADVLQTGKSEAAVYRRSLIELSINPFDIIEEPQSQNTFQNAKYTAAILKKIRVGQVVLVTSAVQLKRAIRYFSYFNIHVIPVASDYAAPRITLLPRSYNFMLTDVAVHEYLGLIKFYCLRFLR